MVITIIGILAAAGSVAYNQFQASARDSIRIADLEQIALALTLDRDNVGEYPTDDSSFATAVQRHMNELPTDPWAGQSSNGATFGYNFTRTACTSDLEAIIVWAAVMEQAGNVSRSQIQYCSEIGDEDLGGDSSYIQVVSFVRN